MLMYKLSAPSDKATYETAIRTYLDSWLTGGDVTYTPGGLAWRSQWGALRYSGNFETTYMHCFALSQIHDKNYIHFSHLIVTEL